ncbi:MAG: guanylate kinase [Holosporales bacterium]|jgi:guanylate kinase|nr:guanylate kinase [Holosporales bacterium]
MLTKPKSGILFVVSSPSGGGKTTLTQRLAQQDAQVFLSVSVTTRPKRPSDIEGKDYHFITQEVFKESARKGAFLEESENFGHFYATPKDPVLKALTEGRDVLLALDIRGYRTIKEQFPLDVVGIFLLPPSLEVLKQRLFARGKEKTRDQRLAEALPQIRSYCEYNYCIVNDDLAQATETSRAIIKAERNRPARLHGLEDLLKE